MKKRKKKEATADKSIQVGCRFYESEIDAMKADTGAAGNATAVSSYVRKRLAARREA